MISPDPRERAKDLLERGLEGAHDQQADYSHLRRQIVWLRLALAALAVALGLLVYFVATTANNADDRSQGTVRYLEGKQGKPGNPGEGGKAGAQGLRGPGPTSRQLDAALRRNCGGSCKGNPGKSGRRGQVGQRGRPPTFAQTLRAARAVCARGACRGEDGRPPTAREIIGAVALYCQVKGCKGDTGADGKDGKPPASFTFTDATGNSQICTHPEGSLDYTCTAIPPAPPPPPAATEPPAPAPPPA